jgi:phage terminase large subunit-like protein
MAIDPKKIKMIAELTPAERKYILSKEENFPYFFVYYFVDYVNYPFADFHYDMFSDVAKMINCELREVGWIAFRESAKTSIAKGFVTYLAAYNKRNYINVDSYSKENAERILFDIVLEMQTNKRLVEDFGQMYNAKRENNEVTQKRVSNFITNNGVRVEAHSTQEPVRGRLSRQFRPDAVILDDFETDKTIASEATTLSIRNHIGEFQGGLAPNAFVLYLGNYISEYCNVQWLMDRAKEDDKIMIRNIPVMVSDEPTWPGKYVRNDVDKVGDNVDKVSIETIEKRLSSPDEGNRRFLAEMMNEPVDYSHQIFHKEMFKYVEWDDITAKSTACYVTIDTAVSQEAKADYTGITINWVDTEGMWHLKSFRKKITPTEVIDLIFGLHNQYHPEKIGIEKGMYTSVIKPFLQEEMRERNVYPYIVEVEHQNKKKEARIEWLLPRYEAGSIFHLKGECGDLENELMRHPVNVHDDVADSASMQTQIAQRRYSEGLEELNEPETYSDIGI